MARPTIVIADDDQDLVELLTLRCRQFGFVVESAGDALTALLKIQRTRPSIVILDVNMPSGGGLNLREMMADNPDLVKIPVIIITGATDCETIRRCHNTCAYYVAKCPDIWPRIEPLLREFCPDVSSISPEDDDSSVASAEAMMSLDSVFAALSWDAAFLEKAKLDAENPPSDDSWVLCIDDDAEYAASLRMRFKQRGVHLVNATAGMSGYRQAFTSPADAILLDVNMPDGSGDYILRRLKENEITRDIPVIVVTGERSKPLERKMYNLGAAEYFTKPVEWERLWQAYTRVRATRASQGGLIGPSRRAMAAVDSSSPQGAMRSVGPSQASTATSPGFRSSTSAISTS